MINKDRQYDSVVGAKLLLALAYGKGIALNTTKVQKLLYIIYSYLLSHEGYKIFDETPKAWPYGPVFPRTRNKVDFGKVYTLDDHDLKDIKDDKEIVKVFNKVIDGYADFSAKTLSDWSHLPKSPWEKTTKLPGFKWGDHIPDEYIVDYFKDVEF